MDLSLEQFRQKRDRLVELLKGDYFFGTRDVTMTAKTSRALFQYGIPGWLDVTIDAPIDSFVKSNFDQLSEEIDRVYLGGAKERVADLIFREKNEEISSDEKLELDHYLILEHLLRLAKARAYNFVKEEA